MGKWLNCSQTQIGYLVTIAPVEAMRHALWEPDLWRPHINIQALKHVLLTSCC